VQVALAPPARLRPSAPIAQRIDLETARIAVVSTRPDQFAAALRKRAPGRRVVALAPSAYGERPDGLDVSVGERPAILIGDPDLWQAQWSLLGTLQRGCDVLFDGCSLAELRALTRSRDLPPPFSTGARPLWIRTRDGLLARATLDDC
jgi:S-DNA-T family DNA segregation ATPase FtsK/SpoIIIE